MSHLTEENRKTISSMIAHNNTCVDIAEAIGCDPTTIAKEIKRNRVISRESTTKNKFYVRSWKDFHMFVLTVVTSTSIVFLHI